MTFIHIYFAVFVIFVQSIKGGHNLKNRDDIVTFNQNPRQVLNDIKIEELERFNKIKDLLSRYTNIDEPASQNNTNAFKNIALALKGFQDHFYMKLDTNVTDGISNVEILPTDATASSIKMIEKLLIDNPKNVLTSIVVDVIFKPYYNPNPNTSKCCNDTVLHAMKLIQQHYNNYKANIAKCETSNNTLPANVFGENQYFLGSYREKVPLQKTFQDMPANQRQNFRNWFLYYRRRNNNVRKGIVERDMKSTFATLDYCEQLAIQEFLEFVKMFLQRKVKEIISTCNEIASQNTSGLDCEENMLRKINNRNLKSDADASEIANGHNQLIILRRIPKQLLWESIEAVTDVALKEILKKLLEEENQDVMLLIKEILVRWLLKKLKDHLLLDNDKKKSNNIYKTPDPFKAKENKIFVREVENISFWKKIVGNLSKEEARKVLTLLLQHADVQGKVVSMLKQVVGRDLSAKMQSALHVYNLLSRKPES